MVAVQNLKGEIIQLILSRKGGGGAHLKKLRRARAGAKMFGVFRVKNRHKSYFFQF